MPPSEWYGHSNYLLDIIFKLDDFDAFEYLLEKIAPSRLIFKDENDKARDIFMQYATFYNSGRILEYLTNINQNLTIL